VLASAPTARDRGEAIPEAFFMHQQDACVPGGTQSDRGVAGRAGPVVRRSTEPAASSRAPIVPSRRLTLTRWFPGRAPTLSEAAARYGSSRQNVKQIALGLEARGYVRLTPDPVDARATRIEVTDRVAVFDEPEMVAHAHTMLADVCAGLSPRETLSLRDLMRSWLAGVASGDEDMDP
jgi:DNA-binding MarR family transcriptional regulator